MNAISRVTEYYIQASKLRVEIQSIRKLFKEVFQIALNSSLIAGKVDVANVSAEVYKTESKLLSKIASEMDYQVENILALANDLTKISLIATNYHNLALHLTMGMQKTHGESNKILLQRAIEKNEQKVEEALSQVREYRVKLMHYREEIQKLIRKIWVTKNSIESEARVDNNNKEFSNLASELEAIVERAETRMDNMDKCFFKIDQLLVY